MNATSLKVENVRNLKNGEIFFHDGVNVLYGQNAQGKTNLLEALWLCTGARSFRDAKDTQIINFDSEAARIKLNFYTKSRNQNLELTFRARKAAVLNGVSLKSPTGLIGNFNAVVFAPGHLSLIKDGAGERRKFIDSALCQLRPAAQSLCFEYRRALEQRNALLKAINEHTADISGLDLWDEALAKTGAALCRQRQKYIEAISPHAAEFYQGLSKGKEALTLFYNGEDFSADDGFMLLLNGLKQSRSEDLRRLVTCTGPHRHDIEVMINGISAREYASQGQQRSAALSLKLAEAAVLSSFSGEQPVALLDDVMSELDTQRQDYILNRLSGRQVFITCCDPAQVLKMTGGKAFLIKDGEIKNVR